jgi:hypothetical protein
MHSLTVGEFKQRLGDVAWYAVFRNGVKLPNNSALGQNDIVVARIQVPCFYSG